MENTYNGVFLFLSYLSQSQVSFNHPGLCPSAPIPSTEFNSYSTVADFYHAVGYYNSETGAKDIFGDGFKNKGRCMSLRFIDLAVLSIELVDCGNYYGSLNWSNHRGYELTLENANLNRPCYKHKIVIERLSVWADERNDILLFWICKNDYHAEHHHHMVLVYLNSANVTRNSGDMTLNLDAFARVIDFTKEMLKFTALDTDSFEFSAPIKEDNSCIISCSNNCTEEVTDSSIFPGPLVFFIVICLLVLIICVVLL